MKALQERLHELGYSEGKNMTFEYRSAEGRPERLPQLAMELVQARPDVLIAGFGSPVTWPSSSRRSSSW
jgi:putative ABC transport system substrate-binding protein